MQSLGQPIRFLEPMGSIISDQEAVCRNVDNTSVYQFRHQANEAAFQAPACYDPESGYMAASGGASDRALPSSLIDLDTQMRRGANSVTSCRLYRPEAASAAERSIISVMSNAPLKIPPQCAGSVRSIHTGVRRDEFPVYSYFPSNADGLPPLPVGTILPGIDTRRELKDAWKRRNPTTPSSASVAFIPGSWTGSYGASVPGSSVPGKTAARPLDGTSSANKAYGDKTARPIDGASLANKAYGQHLMDFRRRHGCEALGC